MDIFGLIAAMVSLSAFLGYLNVRFLKLPGTIGLLVVSLLFTILILFLGKFNPHLVEIATEFVETLDFRRVLMDFMLCFLLFAGSLHTNFAMLLKNRWPILTFATLGVVLSAVLVGSMLYGLLNLVGMGIPYLHCVIFGALISPTDPVAVLGIMKKANVPKKLEIKVVGESLFNDGIGVVVFVTLLGLTQINLANFNPSDVGVLLLKEVGGGIGIGLALGYLCFRMMKTIDHYQTEVMLSLAFVMGGFWLAHYLHMSGPIAMVVAGLFLGNETSKTARSDVTEAYLQKFWEILDVLLNYVLFIMIGLELLIIDFTFEIFLLGLAAIVIVLVSRFITLVLPVRAFRDKLKFLPYTGWLMTWAGLRGGISIALAMSLPLEIHRELLLAITYIVVVFSIVVQGLTLGKVTKSFLKNHSEELESI